MNKDLLQQALALQAWSQSHRRYLHQYPEVSLAERDTANYCQKVLYDLGYTIKSSWGYGFVADWVVDPSYKTIAFRADMDALAMAEKNDHDFVSQHEGAAHMCGHDTHMTIALTTAHLVALYQSQLTTNIRFIFQPCEEVPPGGALGMIEQGCLEGVDEVYGLHNDPGTQVGHIKTCSGPLMAAGDMFALWITGRGCHAARPQDGLDPITAGSQLINQWQSIISRRANPAHGAVLSVTQFHAGDTSNVIPDYAYLSGTIRTFDNQHRQFIVANMHHALEALRLQGYQCDFEYIKGYDSVVNHDLGVNRVAEAANSVLGSGYVETNTQPQGWGEDFCYYLQHRPGAFYFLGSGNSEKGIQQPLHSSRFQVDEQCLSYGAAVMAAIALQG